VIGVVSIQNPIGQDIPWERSKLARLRPNLSLADPGIEENAGQQLAVTFNPAKAERLFVDSGHSFAEIMKLAEAGKPLPRFPIPATVRASVKFEKKIVESQNVAGILPGSDPRLRRNGAQAACIKTAFRVCYSLITAEVKPCFEAPQSGS
jgi:hypothetical protein